MLYSVQFNSIQYTLSPKMSFAVFVEVGAEFVSYVLGFGH